MFLKIFVSIIYFIKRRMSWGVIDYTEQFSCFPFIFPKFLDTCYEVISNSSLLNFQEFSGNFFATLQGTGRQHTFSKQQGSLLFPITINRKECKPLALPYTIMVSLSSLTLKSGNFLYVKLETFKVESATQLMPVSSAL